MLPSAQASLSFDVGVVWLAGAGPGDPGLSAPHAPRALSEAEIILHDALVPEKILSLGLEAAGKRARGERTRRPRINQGPVALARQMIFVNGRQQIHIPGLRNA